MSCDPSEVVLSTRCTGIAAGAPDGRPGRIFPTDLRPKCRRAAASQAIAAVSFRWPMDRCQRPADCRRGPAACRPVADIHCRAPTGVLQSRCAAARCARASVAVGAVHSRRRFSAAPVRYASGELAVGARGSGHRRLRRALGPHAQLRQPAVGTTNRSARLQLAGGAMALCWCRTTTATCSDRQGRARGRLWFQKIGDGYAAEFNSKETLWCTTRRTRSTGCTNWTAATPSSTTSRACSAARSTRPGTGRSQGDARQRAKLHRGRAGYTAGGEHHHGAVSVRVRQTSAATCC